ncbi:MAG TPA: ABC transporter ATP-binding protein, partial [Candidatus Atribacteria bacterium]|nr:ABC transporter ATP-binding protein [Candidatus Atribacteria bacterium]
MKGVRFLRKTKYILEFKNIVKTFPGIVANDHINLKIKRGDIHALLGENGAGKTTLMNILTGLYAPNSGEIYINDKKVKINSPKDSINLGIGMVHQHYKLVDTLKVSENIIIGSHKQKWMINNRVIFDEIISLSEKYGLAIRPNELVGNLSVGEKQRVEIIKMLYRNVEILVLDEPTSVLTLQECQNLFKTLREMKRQGKTIIFISHKLNEVMDVADTITVLRQGKIVNTLAKVDTNPIELTRMMFERETETITKNTLKDLQKAETVLVVEGLKALGDEGEISLNDVSFSIKKGEILGVAGVSGNGQKELAEVLTGLRPLVKGKIIIQGKEIREYKPIEFINNGISHIPADRIGVGTIPDFNCIENVILKTYRKQPIKKGLILDFKEANKIGEQLLNKYDVRISSYYIPVRLLSGGNLQKLILAREISCNHQLIIAVHPTYGLDVSAVNMIHKFFLEEQKKGVAILLISEDLDEILALSDEITVMYKGKLTPKQLRQKCSIENIGRAMMGI